jgi:hypothetical protein
MPAIRKSAKHLVLPKATADAMDESWLMRLIGMGGEPQLPMPGMIAPQEVGRGLVGTEVAEKASSLLKLADPRSVPFKELAKELGEDGLVDALNWLFRKGRADLSPQAHGWVNKAKPK